MEDPKNYVIYCRVSTREQGDSGLGLSAQLNTCRKYVRSVDGKIIGEFNDVKSGSSRRRAGLLSALEKARKNDATVVFAKLDRMAREAEYAHSIRNSGVRLYFCDFPEINTLLFGILVSVAQYERELGQQRTKDGLSVIKRKLESGETHVSKKSGEEVRHLGRQPGTSGPPMSKTLVSAWKDKISSDPNRRRQWLLMRDLYGRGDTMDQIAATMNATGEPAPRGGEWTKGQVSRALSGWIKYFEKDGSLQQAVSGSE